MSAKDTPLDQLIQDRKDSLKDIVDCQNCLNIGIFTYGNGKLVKDRLLINVEIIDVIDKELERRGMNIKKVWTGKVYECDLCSARLLKHFVDGATKYGPWANMCLDCHKAVGVGLGGGRGQKYELQETEWVGIEV